MSDVTPNDMPGAAKDASKDAAEEQDAVSEVVDAQEPPEKGLSPEKLAELNRTLRNERKAAERKAREAEAKATEAEQRWQQLAELFGGKENKADDFDPKSAIEALNAKLEAAETARVRAEVARLTGVDPEDIHGSTEDDMRASAERWTQRFQQRLDEALKAKNAPSAPPASTVTSDGKITGPEQITSKDELAKLSPTEQMKAYREGRLNGLMGKS